MTLILGLGNPLRADDGVGPAVIAELRQHDLPADIEVIDGGTPGLETILYFQDHERAIIVDAADMNQPPGHWVRVEYGQVELQGAAGLRGTLHAAGLAEALELGNALDALPRAIIIYAIQPQDVGWTEGLSTPVQAAVPQVCTAILAEIQD